MVRLHQADTVTGHRLPAADQFLLMVGDFAEACVEPTRRDEHRSAIVGQATLLEAVVRLSDATPSTTSRAGRPGGHHVTVA